MFAEIYEDLEEERETFVGMSFCSLRVCTVTASFPTYACFCFNFVVDPVWAQGPNGTLLSYSPYTFEPLIFEPGTIPRPGPNLRTAMLLIDLKFINSN